MPPRAINFADKLSRFESFWSPRIVAEMNDYQFKLVKL
ncbi:MAG TPA: cupin, partial [Burkholderiales bacterium]